MIINIIKKSDKKTRNNREIELPSSSEEAQKIVENRLTKISCCDIFLSLVGHPENPITQFAGLPGKIPEKKEEIS